VFCVFLFWIVLCLVWWWWWDVVMWSCWWWDGGGDVVVVVFVWLFSVFFFSQEGRASERASGRTAGRFIAWDRKVWSETNKQLTATRKAATQAPMALRTASTMTTIATMVKREEWEFLPIRSEEACSFPEERGKK
jgi:hypothetical protein